jgi:hypothetical protein
MTPEMKKNLLRYGRVIFLDGQKRQYNTMNWPYIGPALKDKEMKVCLGAESLVVEESLKMYKWVLESMCEMEPRFDLSQIRIIFGDQLITAGLLVSLGIDDSCLLRPDFYHLTNEVWPKPNNFGSILYPQIKNFLEAMLKSTTETEYTNAFEAALEIVRYEPSKRSLLESIYENYQYYAGYFLSNVLGNLGLLGSVPAEQNHASIVAHLGEGASWEIAQQITQLMNRQKELTKQRTEKENSLYCSTLHYKSSKRGQSAQDDEAAKTLLSNYAYQKLFLKSFQGARYLRHKFDQEGICYVWPAKYGLKTIYGLEDSEVNFEADDHLDPELLQGCYGLHKIPVNGRCPCRDQVHFMVQCAHEYHRDGKFLPELYSGDQWYSRRKYDEWLVTLGRDEVHQTPGGYSYIDEMEGGNDDYTMVGMNSVEHRLPLPVQEEETSYQGEEQEATFDEDNDNHSTEDVYETRYSYSTVSRQCDELCRFVANDQTQLHSVFSTVSEMLDRLRRGSNIGVYFLEDTNVNAASRSAQSGGCLLGMGRSITNANKMKRKRSGREIQMSKGRRVTTNFTEIGESTTFEASDENHLAAPKSNCRSCSMCRLKGHFINNCPMLVGYGMAPLEKGNMLPRHQLQARLSAVGALATARRQPDRELFTTLPTRIHAIVLHQRYYICDSVDSPEFAGNYCVECTLINRAGEEHPDYTRALFSAGCVGTYVVRSQTNIVINLLAESISAGIQPRTHPFSQSTIAHGSALAPIYLNQSQEFSQQFGAPGTVHAPVYHNYQESMGYGLMGPPM